MLHPYLGLVGWEAGLRWCYSNTWTSLGTGSTAVHSPPVSCAVLDSCVSIIPSVMLSSIGCADPMAPPDVDLPTPSTWESLSAELKAGLKTNADVWGRRFNACVFG